MSKIFKLSLATVLCLTQCVQQSIAAKENQKVTDKLQDKYALSTLISISEDNTFPGSPKFIIKNCENLSKCIPWDVFYNQYQEKLSAFSPVFGKESKAYVLPHYNNGNCLFHAIGIDATKTYDLMIESAEELVKIRPAVHAKLETIQTNLIQKKSHNEKYVEAIANGINGKALETIFNTYDESPEEVSARQKAEEDVSLLEAALEETFNGFFPGQEGIGDLERFNWVSRILERKDEQEKNKKDWMELLRKNGGRSFKIGELDVAIRPLHNSWFFQQVANYLCVIIEIFDDGVKRVHVPNTERPSSSIPTLYLHGTLGHYEPVVKEGVPVSLALIRDMENFSKIPDEKRLKVTQKNCIEFPVKSEEKPDAELASRVEQEKADAELAARQEQETEDAKFARQEQETEDAKFARHFKRVFEK
jgi:hypothetical protein